MAGEEGSRLGVDPEGAELRGMMFEVLGQNLLPVDPINHAITIGGAVLA